MIAEVEVVVRDRGRVEVWTRIRAGWKVEVSREESTSKVTSKSESRIANQGKCERKWKFVREIEQHIIAPALALQKKSSTLCK